MMELPAEMAPPADHQQRILAAQAHASFELGDSSWADSIIDVYLGRTQPDDEAIEAWEGS